MTNNSVLRLILAGVGVIVLLGGCASASISGAGYEAPASGSADLSTGAGSLKVVSALPAPAASSGGGQVIRVGDKLRVDVFGVDELDREAPVDGSGRVTLPLIGSVQVAGLTLEAAQSRITGLYGARYLQNPEISVSAEQTVTLDGEFRKAGFYPVSGNSSLLRVIAAAGNFTEIGDPNNVFVYRTVGGQDYVAKYNVADIRAGRRADAPIYGGDIVVGFPSGMKVLGSNLSSALGLARSATVLVP
ncbi:MAG: polysaccharide biosynthesis/export family protein [Devosia sp.]